MAKINKRRKRIFDMLKSHPQGLNGEAISQQLGVSSRTIRSDIKALQDALEKYNIKIIDWFESKEEYINTIKFVDVYFAPRIYEGIGLSFLEIMSYGKYIVAFNNPTMNEYIINQKNGFLFDFKTTDIVNFSKINQKEIKTRKKPLVLIKTP